MAIALVVLVMLTCTMTYIQEKSASDVMKSLKKMMPNKVSGFLFKYLGITDCIISDLWLSIY